jgi:hypothetical protein
MILFDAFYCIAFLATSFVHLYFNSIVDRILTMVKLCLASPGQPVLQSILRLHSVVLLCFMLALCFDTVSAYRDQALLGQDLDVLKVSIGTQGRLGPC